MEKLKSGGTLDAVKTTKEELEKPRLGNYGKSNSHINFSD